MGIFSSKHKSRVTEQDKAVLQLKQQRDKLKQYQKRIENNLERDRQLCKELLRNGKKEKAKSLLRKKKFQEEQLNKAEGMLENVEKLTHNLEFTQVEMRVLESLKAGNVALRQLHQLINIDEVEKIMDETKEGIEKQKEIDEMIHGHLTQEDEEAVLQELEELLDQTKAETEKMLDKLPDVPTTIEEPKQKEKVREKVKKKEKVALTA